MPTNGDDRPPERSGQPDSSDQPEYTVYGPGGEERKERPPPKRAEPEGEPDDAADESEGRDASEGGDDGTEQKPSADQEPEAEPAEEPEAEPEKKPEVEQKPKREGKPEYTVYRSRRGLRDRFGKPDMAGLRRERRGPGGGYLDRVRGAFSGGGWRRWLRWILIAAGVWLLISFISFAISAQIQKGELADSAKEELSPASPLLGANILVLGGDRRGASQENAVGIETQGPPRADSIMVIHTALGSFRKLSIPRDSLAQIPGCGTQKINASLACNTQSNDGNPGLTIRTVENFLGIEINHIVIVDFQGFADFIDTLGGVEIDVFDRGRKEVAPPCRLKNRTLVVAGDVDGGKGEGGVSIGLTGGEHTLEGEKALAFARLRHNICDAAETDIDRAKRQQLVLNGIKGRLTSITRFPINFVKGPWIGWNAPKGIVSDMGGLNLPQVALTSFFGGGDTSVLEPTADGPGGSLLISANECRKKVAELLGSDPPEEPACSPGI
jgi:LCP family protein required for cell wall assembly